MNIERLCELKRTREYRRLGTLFTTSQYIYLYDTGTGKVVQLDEESQKCFKALFDDTIDELKFRLIVKEIPSIDCICKFIQEENLLCCPAITKFAGSDALYTDEMFRCSQLTIELTGKCNLRCKYCIYNDYFDGMRTFNTSSIDFETARKAIDFVFNHRNEEHLAITFYGGEPLLNFQVMRQCIDYCLEKSDPTNLSFSFTTNLTLMTPEIADYIAQVPNMSILLSMDGPEEIHNCARVKRDGTGSFKDAFAGLQVLAAAVNKYKCARIAFNAVLTPPYTKERFDEINDFFEKLDFLPSDTEVRATYPAAGSIPDSYYQELRMKGITFSEETDWNSWAKEKYGNQIDLNEKKNLHYSVLTGGLVLIQNRRLRETPVGIVPSNGCCAPGKRRLYVCTDGTYKVCERIGDSPSIGNVNDGVDVKAVKKYYLEEYEAKSLPDCSQCWAVNLCDICYAQCYDKAGVNIKEKRKLCPGIRKKNIQYLSDYHEMLESNSEVLEEISKIEIV